MTNKTPSGMKTDRDSKAITWPKSGRADFVISSIELVLEQMPGSVILRSIMQTCTEEAYGDRPFAAL